MLSRRPIPGDSTVHYLPARKRRPRPRPQLQPPMVPMIDVTFQLLLFFLLTMPTRPEGQLPSALPQAGLAAAQEVEELKPIRITLRPSGPDRSGCVYELSGEAVGLDSPEKLYEALVARREAYGSDEVPVSIRARQDVRWRYVVEAFNQAMRARFKHVGLAPPK